MPGLSNLAAMASRIAMTGEVLRAFAATDFSGPTTGSPDGPGPTSPVGPAVTPGVLDTAGAGRASQPTVALPSAGNGFSAADRFAASLAGLRNPAAAASDGPSPTPTVVQAEPDVHADRAAAPAGSPPSVTGPARGAGEDAVDQPSSPARTAAPARPAPEVAAFAVDGEGSGTAAPRQASDLPRADGVWARLGGVSAGREPAAFDFVAAESAVIDPLTIEPAEPTRPAADVAGTDIAAMKPAAAFPADMAAFGGPSTADEPLVPQPTATTAMPRPPTEGLAGAAGAPQDGARARSAEASKTAPRAERSGPGSAADAARIADHDSGVGSSPGSSAARPTLPVIRHDAVADIDLRFFSEGAAAAGPAGSPFDRSGVVAFFVFNAAMLPGWPPPQPFEAPDREAMLASLLDDPRLDGRVDGMAEALAGEAGTAAAGALKNHLKRLSRSRRRRMLLGLAALMGTIETVIDAIEQELLDLARAKAENCDEMAEAGFRRQLTA